MILLILFHKTNQHYRSENIAISNNIVISEEKVGNIFKTGQQILVEKFCKTEPAPRYFYKFDSDTLFLYIMFISIKQRGHNDQEFPICFME